MKALGRECERNVIRPPPEQQPDRQCGEVRWTGSGQRLRIPDTWRSGHNEEESPDRVAPFRQVIND